MSAFEANSTKDSSSIDSDDEINPKIASNLNHEEILNQGSASKDAGNAAFKSKNNEKAKAMYADALNTIKPLNDMKPPDISDNHHEMHKQLSLSLHLNSAAVHIRTEEWKKTVEHATNALDIEEGNVKALYRRGVAHHRSGDFTNSKADLLNILKKDPKNREALKELQKLKEKLLKQKEDEKKSFSAAFQKVSVSGGMYGDKEREKKRAEQAKKLELAKRRKQWKEDSDALEAKGEPGLTFEEWEKKQKEEKKKQEKLEKERRQKEEQARDELRRKHAKEQAQKLKEADLELDEDDLAAIADAKKKGYCYFKRDLSEEEKNLIGNITPSKVEQPQNGSSTAGSAWNSNGTTWEEKNVLEWAKTDLKQALNELSTFQQYSPNTHVSLKKVKKVDGDAQIIISSGKVRRVYDLALEIDWEAKHDGSDEVSKGSLIFPEISSMTAPDQFESKFNVSKRSAAPTLESALKEFENATRSKIAEFLDRFHVKE